MNLDLEAITAKWLHMCGSCDGGLPMNCTCPGDDPRNVIADLVAEIEGLRREAATPANQPPIGRTLAGGAS